MTRDRRISLANIGSVADDPIPAFVPILEGAFNAHIEITDEVPLPRSAYNASRDQYLSSNLLDVLAERKQRDWDRLLGIVDGID